LNDYNLQMTKFADLEIFFFAQIQRTDWLILIKKLSLQNSCAVVWKMWFFRFYKWTFTAIWQFCISM